MRRLLVLLTVALAFAPPAGAYVLKAPASAKRAVTAPSGLHAFLLRPDEARQVYYPRTPSFTWQPRGRGGTYDFELATSRSFNDSSVLFSYSKLAAPAVSIDHQLPWMTGQPFALWAHVRWESADGQVVTPWSKPFGFNMRWSDSDEPQQLPAPEGMIRWKPIDGATRYEVLYPDLSGATSFETTTNVADEREFFTFRNQLGYSSAIHWRVRAIRYIDDSDVLKNGLPRATYGPWSPVFTSVNPPQALGELKPTDTVSDTWDRAGQKASPHELTPGFAWSPSTPVIDPAIGSVGSSLYRVYIFTDNHCVNEVFAGSIVGSPAFAPRTVGGPFALPQDTRSIAQWNTPPYLTKTGSEGNAFDATGMPVKPNELPGSKLSANAPTNAAGGALGAADASVDLWDSGWPSGRYYWTVIPVEVEGYGPPPAPTKDGTVAPRAVEYHETVVPQDQCEAGLSMSFGKVSQPVVTAQTDAPWVSGLSPDGRMVASAAKVPTVHDSPLVAWEPAVGATTYEVQLSRKQYPWKTSWSTTTAATSVILPLGKAQVGNWWYRVRGINPALPAGAEAMSWSSPVRLKVSGDRYVVLPSHRVK